MTDSLGQLVQSLEAQLKAKRNQPRVRIVYRGCFQPGCQGWIKAEHHGAFRFGKVRYWQYVNGRCNCCDVAFRELVRSRLEGEPEVNGPNFLLHDPVFEQVYEVPGVGRSMLPFLRQAWRSGEEIEVLLKPMFERWLRHCRREYVERLECFQ